MSVCGPLNLSVQEENSYASRVTMGDYFPCIVFSLVKQKVSGGQEQEEVFVAMKFTVQVSTFC